MSNDASQPEAQRRNYKSVFDAGTRIINEEGPAAFYRGSQVCVSFRNELSTLARCGSVFFGFYTILPPPMVYGI